MPQASPFVQYDLWMKLGQLLGYHDAAGNLYVGFLRSYTVAADSSSHVLFFDQMPSLTINTPGIANLIVL